MALQRRGYELWRSALSAAGNQYSMDNWVESYKAYMAKEFPKEYEALMSIDPHKSFPEFFMEDAI